MSDASNRHVYGFAWQSGSWTQLVHFSDPHHYSDFGRSNPYENSFELSKDGKVLVASDNDGLDNSGDDAGRVYVYTSLTILTCGRSDDDGLGAPPSNAVGEGTNGGTTPTPSSCITLGFLVQ